MKQVKRNLLRLVNRPEPESGPVRAFVHTGSANGTIRDPAGR